MKYRALIIAAAITIILGAIFGRIYFDDHSWGAWGDDSAGYIYLAGLMYEGEPLVYFDELVAKGYEYFQDEKLSRWLTPTHHFLINQQGVIASKYPVGASMLMVWFARIVGNSDGFYIMTPFLAALNVALVYILAVLLFPKNRYRHAIGILAAVFLGFSGLYYDYAIAQPMREIPSITFLLLATIFLIQSVRLLRDRDGQMPLAIALLALSGLSFGMSVNVRETSLLVLPGLAVFAIMELWGKQHGTLWVHVRRLLPYVAVFFVSVVIGVVPTIQNSYNLSQEKEVFKERDTSEVVLLSNIGHINTISIENVFDNQGKFRPGKGSLPHYWGVMQKSVPVPYFLVFVALGIVFLWRESRSRTLLLLLWFLGTLTIFSLWVNPYSRYILPLFPPLMLFGAYGIVTFLQKVVPTFFQGRAMRILAALCVGVGFVAAYQPVFAQVRENLHTDVYQFKAISQNDFGTLHTIAEDVRSYQDGDREPVIMFTGEWQYGTSETLQAHTGVKTIRSPFEQRFAFDQEELLFFLNEQLLPGQETYIWIDATTAPQTMEWFEDRNVKEVGAYQFTFQPDVHIYRIQ